MAKQLPPLVTPTSPYVMSDGKPTQPIYQYFQILDQLVRALTGGNIELINAANDPAAAALGVQINQLYRNGNAVQVRLT